MKKLLYISAMFLCTLVTQVAYADDAASRPTPVDNSYNAPRPGMPGRDYSWDEAQRYHRQYAQDYHARNQCAPADHACCDQPCNECWCLYVHYEPCYYCTPRCVEEQVPYQEKCCRYVPKYYECERCRYVPQYYKETYCCQEPEYYYVTKCKTCSKTVYDQQCEYVPQYYWRHSCGDASMNVPCPCK